MKQITYCIDKESGFVYSRVGSDVAVPVLQYDKIGANGDFTQPLEYQLEKCSVLSLASYWPNLRWTKKIPTNIKNNHRAFWGLPQLKEVNA